MYPEYMKRFFTVIYECQQKTQFSDGTVVIVYHAVIQNYVESLFNAVKYHSWRTWEKQVTNQIDDCHEHHNHHICLGKRLKGPPHKYSQHISGRWCHRNFYFQTCTFLLFLNFPHWCNSPLWMPVWLWQSSRFIAEISGKQEESSAQFYLSHVR